MPPKDETIVAQFVTPFDIEEATGLKTGTQEYSLLRLWELANIHGFIVMMFPQANGATPQILVQRGNLG